MAKSYPENVGIIAIEIYFPKRVSFIETRCLMNQGNWESFANDLRCQRWIDDGE